MYNQEYESAAAFWPDVHGRIISAMVFSQLILMGLMSTKGAANTTPFLIALPILTIYFHKFCKGRYEPAFIRYPLQVTAVNIFFIISIRDQITSFCALASILMETMKASSTLFELSAVSLDADIYLSVRNF